MSVCWYIILARAVQVGEGMRMYICLHRTNFDVILMNSHSDNGLYCGVELGSLLKTSIHLILT